MLPGLDPVHKISIVPRGFGALGYTMQLPLEDRYLMTRTDLHGQLAVLLGGRTAEEIAFGEISTGAQNDLQRATDIARAMVTEFGMSDAGRPGQLQRPQAQHVPRDAVHARARQLCRADGAGDRHRGQAHPDRGARRGAPRCCSSRRDALDVLSQRLLEVEVIESTELLAILGPVPPKVEDPIPAEIPPV